MRLARRGPGKGARRCRRERRASPVPSRKHAPPLVRWQAPLPVPDRPAYARVSRSPPILMSLGPHPSSTRAVRVLTVDDQAVFRGVARDVIEATAGFESIGEAADGEEAL